MTIRTRAELDEALRRVFVDAIADEEPATGADAEPTLLVTIAARGDKVADLGPLAPAPRARTEEVAR